MGNGASAPKPKDEPVRTANTPKNPEISKGATAAAGPPEGKTADAGPAEGKTADAGPVEGKTADAGPVEGKANEQKSSEEKVDLMGVIRCTFSIFGDQFVFY